MRASQVDLENTVVPFYNKIKDRKKLTIHEISRLLQYRNELKEIINRDVTGGQGLKAVKYYADKFEGIFQKVKLRSDIINS